MADSADRPAAVERAQDAGAGADVVETTFDAGTFVMLRNTVAAHAGRLGLADERVLDLVLIVQELAANAVRHGAGHGRMRLWRSGTGDIVCEVSDPGTDADCLHGHGFEPLPANAVGGRGIWLVRQLADAVDIRTGSDGTHVTVTVHLTGDTSG
jgi:anti-sigma regulatory factor (Ser/Thr protein kinase)